MSTTPGGLRIPGDVAERIERDPSVLAEHMPRPVVDSSASVVAPPAGIEWNVVVRLSESQQSRAQSAGEARFARRRREGSKQRYGRKEDEHTIYLEVEAIGAEVAVVEGVIGRKWVDTDTPDYDGDGAPCVQVRHTTHATGRLLLHDGDHDDHRFYLVTGNFPEYVVRGSIMGDAGKEAGVVRELQPGRPAICVEQIQLEGVGRA